MENNICRWEDEQFIPCIKMEKDLDNYRIGYRISYQRMDNGALHKIDTCPYCDNDLKDNDTIDYEYKTLRKFQIKNLRSDGCGSYYYVSTPIYASLEEIKNMILNKLSEEKDKEDSYLSFSFFRKSSFNHNRKMKIVELDIRTYNTKRKGLKGFAYFNKTKLEGINVLTGNKFERTYSYFDMEWI